MNDSPLNTRSPYGADGEEENDPFASMMEPLAKLLEGEVSKQSGTAKVIKESIDFYERLVLAHLGAALSGSFRVNSIPDFHKQAVAMVLNRLLAVEEIQKAVSSDDEQK